MCSPSSRMAPTTATATSTGMPTTGHIAAYPEVDELVAEKVDRAADEDRAEDDADPAREVLDAGRRPFGAGRGDGERERLRQRHHDRTREGDHGQGGQHRRERGREDTADESDAVDEPGDADHP